ncbi:helix-turn-helix transcriptional regulator [Actinacidiphila acididurans]|uniref:Helix-turn-helix transcriptional regulator n=1 Tax=Actinacidiphila acididurans TaxID=2784346 RepID=A0ABS2TLA7_9ACTN|nr:LuxR C-terminal-related transcriptional regulator [Actinacidiphila acididurans]MBM9504119.1 helix-turn-helix transcriptional regulator [Actinacidiphila acididurans]
MDTAGDRHLYQVLLSDPNADPLDVQRQSGYAAQDIEAALGRLMDLEVVVPAVELEGLDALGGTDHTRPGWQACDDGEPASATGLPRSRPWLTAASPRVSLMHLIDQNEAELNTAMRRIRTLRTTMAAIVAEYDALYAREAGGGNATVVLGRERIDALLLEAGRGARREVVSMHHAVPVTAGMLARPGAGRADAGQPAARVIHLMSTARTPQGLTNLQELAETGADVRLMAHTPFRLLVADSSLAVVERLVPRAQPAAVVLRGRELGEALREVFDFCWLSAAPLAEHRAQAEATALEQRRGAGDPAERPERAERSVPAAVDRRGAPRLTEQQRAVLRMLTDGMKDEAIARSLGISVRTLGRLIGGLMADLRVTSRYQLGVRASVLGWVH